MLVSIAIALDYEEGNAKLKNLQSLLQETSWGEPASTEYRKAQSGLQRKLLQKIKICRQQQ